jgi:N-acetylglucosamine kinase
MTLTSPLLCADIGGSFIDCALVYPDGTLGPRDRTPTPTDDLDAFLTAMADIAAQHPGVDLHIALAGLQDPATGICTAANIPCVNGVDLAGRLSALTGRRVRIGNDADCFALAESRLGAAQGHENVLGIILGTGVGGGLVLGGRLVTGAGGLTGEWGHGPFIPHIVGAEQTTPCFPCGCGQRGCIDTIGGARGLERLHHWSCGRTLDSRAILAAWRDSQPDACRTLDHYIGYVSSALALAVNLTGTTAVPVGGGLSNAPDLIAALDRAVRTRILRTNTPPLLSASRLGGDAGLIGAAFL